MYGLYLVEYDTISNNEPIIYLFQRDENNQKKIIPVRGFIPYFFVDENEEIPAEAMQFILKIEQGFKNDEDQNVKKIYVKHPSNIPMIREMFSKTYLADVLYNLRFMIDKIDFIEPSNYRTCYIDIETQMEGAFPDPETTEQAITSISFYDNYENKYYTVVWHNDIKENNIEELEDEHGKKIIFKFKNEKDMLLKFIELQTMLLPDIWLAWNMTFDFSYIINRMKKLSLPFQKLSPINKVKVAQKNIPIIGGIALIDVMYWLRRIRLNEYSSFALANIAEVELGEQKYDVRDPYKLWLKDWRQAIKYNQHDVYLTKKIEEKRRIIRWLDEVRCMTFVNFSDIVYFSRVLDTFIIKKHKNKYVFRTKPPFTGTSEIKGGFVSEPNIGLHNNVIVLDISGAYPNIIKTFNLSYDTLVKEGEIKIDEHISFTNRKIGVIPSIIDDLFKVRQKWKDEMKKHNEDSIEYQLAFDRSFATKFLINTTYGACALSSFRYHKTEVANTITFLCRELIQWCSKKVKKDLGYDVIYNDTDSIFIKLDKNDDPNIKGQEIVTYLNSNLLKFVKKYYPEAKTHTLQLGVDKIFEKILLIAKKRYIGLNKKTKQIVSVGVEIRRSDYSKISKTIQKNLMSLIFDNNTTKNDILKYIKQEIQKMKNGTYTYEEISIPTKIEKPLKEYTTNLPKIRGAKWSKKYLQIEYRQGNKPLMLYVIAKDTDVILFESNSQLENVKHLFKIDIEKLAKKNILSVVEKIFIALGWKKEFEEIELNMTNDIIGQKNILNYFGGSNV